MKEEITIQFEVRYTQDAFMTMYGQAYGVPDSTLSKWLADFAREQRVPEVVKRFRVTAKQWDEWTWHERLAGIDAGFNPGRTRKEAFEAVKEWLAHHGDLIDINVPAITLEHFDNEALARTKERLKAQREERAQNEREKKERDRDEKHRLRIQIQHLLDKNERNRDEKHRLRIRIQHLLDKNEREKELYERRIRVLKSNIETL